MKRDPEKLRLAHELPRCSCTPWRKRGYGPRLDAKTKARGPYRSRLAALIGQPAFYKKLVCTDYMIFDV